MPSLGSRLVWLVVVVGLVLTGAPLAGAQVAPPGPPPGPVRVFLDCNYCDFDYLRQEITFVDYVRDQADADVHILVTAESTGGGGRDYAFNFIGQRRFAKVDQVLHSVSKADDTSDAVRKGIARTLKLGLVRYAAETPLAGEIEVTRKAPAAGSQAQAPARDPWDYWFFRSSLSLYGSGEQLTRSGSYSGSLSASRVTEALKIQVSANGRYSESSYEFEDGTKYTSFSRSLNHSVLAAWSLTPHWSAGALASLSSSTYSNQDFVARAAPAIEYNLFPYSESARRQLTFTYMLGARHYRYDQVTLFDKMSETLYDQTLSVSLSMKQPWGSMSTSFEAAHYLHDVGKNHLEVYHDMDVRLFKGFSFSAYGSVSRIRDQLYLPKGGATPEEILVRQRQLATSYYYYYSIGFSYSFGSIHNNVVNTRLRGASAY